MIYIGQCDKLRATAHGEKLWKRMMEFSRPISLSDFLRQVDLTPLLDEDETPGQWITDAVRTDPETTAYISYWGERQCCFLKTAGFEFIFGG